MNTPTDLRLDSRKGKVVKVYLCKMPRYVDNNKCLRNKQVRDKMNDRIKSVDQKQVDYIVK